MDITQSFQTKYLQKTDFPAPRQLIIDTVAMENVAQDNQPQELKPVLYFNGAPKPMVLNRTNANVCAALFGNETTGWQGKTVEVFNDVTIQFQGQLTGGIRIRPVQQVAQPVPPPVPGLQQPVADNPGQPADAPFNDDIPGW